MFIYIYVMYTLFILFLIFIIAIFFSISLHCLLCLATLHLSTSTTWLKEISSKNKSSIVTEILKCMFYYIWI